MGLIEKLQASMSYPTDYSLLPENQPFVHLTDGSTEIELYRLEQRYARRKHRNTFTTNAQYVDGEYEIGRAHV